MSKPVAPPPITHSIITRPKLAVESTAGKLVEEFAVNGEEANDLLAFLMREGWNPPLPPITYPLPYEGYESSHLLGTWNLPEDTYNWVAKKAAKKNPPEPKPWYYEFQVQFDGKIIPVLIDIYDPMWENPSNHE